jgi:hypothetical protein
MATWHTVETARNEWADAPYDEDGGDAILTELLAVARTAVQAFAPDPATSPTYIIVDGIPVLVDDETIPDGYRRAQLLQARNVWNSSRAGASGDFDDGSFGLSSFPLDWQVRQLIRPKRAVPVIG